MWIGADQTVCRDQWDLKSPGQGDNESISRILVEFAGQAGAGQRVLSRNRLENQATIGSRQGKPGFDLHRQDEFAQGAFCRHLPY